MDGWDRKDVLMTVLAATEEVIFLVDREHRITHVNRDYSDTKTEILGTKLSKQFAPQASEHIESLLTQVFASGKEDQCELRAATNEGAELWHSRVLPVFEAGEVESLVVLAKNITKERQQERDRARFFDLTKDLLITATLEGFFKSVTPAFTNLLGYAADELMTRPFVEFVHPDDIQPTISVIQQMGEDGSIDDFENRYLDKSGTYHLIHWSGVYDLDTQLIYAMGRDITEKRRLEDDLLQAQKLDAVGQLAGGLAHDFNNIVLAVMMNAELAMRDATSPLATECLKEIMAAGERAGAVTHQLLSFSKSDIFEPSVVDLRDIASDLTKMVRRLLPESMEIVFEYADEPVLARVDRGQIEQVIVNLCINARDAMPITNGILLIAVESSADGGATIRVRDNGSGMSKEVQQRIFEPYFTTKDRGLGTGLGLSSVYTVLGRHRGRVDVTSSLGNGTEMLVWLPRAEAELAPVQQIDESRETKPGNVTGQRILVAEDDTQVRVVVVHVLEAAGYVVEVATNGEEAIALLKSAPLDIALLDLVMPLASGHEVFLALREHLPAVPVVFSTGYADGRLPDTTLSDPLVALVRKPYRPEVLLDALRRLLTLDDECRS